MSDQTTLTPVDERLVTFYEDTLIGIRANDGQVYVSVRHICDILGIDDNAQRQRLRRHDILNDGIGVCNLQTPGGLQATYVLRVDLLPLWLTGIRAKSVREAMQPKLMRLQREAAKALWEAFQEGRLTSDPTFEALLEQNTPDVQAYKTALAVTNLARQQILLRARLEAQGQQLQNFEQRLEAIEFELGNDERFLTQSQAMQISQAVKAIGLEMSKRSGKNEFGGIYGELYRHFEITSYKNMPASRFDEAITFLNDWLQAIISAAPF
jgi:hypothetical protein